MKNLHLLKEKDRLAIQDFCRQVKKKLGERVIALKLFGSKLRGEDTPESDIDVAVIVRELTPQIEDEVLDIAFDINFELNVYISPIVLSLEVFAHPVWRITPFIQNLEREALPL
jgi:predicted nucleotidyltransferase